MFVELHYPESISNEELDVYLANGWFRMGQAIFTTNFLKFNDVFHSAIWLRIDLLSFETTKFQQKMLKTNAKFEVQIQPLTLAPEQEELFCKYRNHVAFDAAPSVRNLLFGEQTIKPIYDTYEINIYDNEKLIAVGFFDIGQKSAAGISCFYDPAYKKYSLGKYLMYLKMDFCRKQGCTFFYPGYFSPDYNLFDYKLDLAKPSLQYLDLITDAWFPFEAYSSTQIPFDIMCRKLRELGDYLDKQNIKYQFQYYDFFDADMISNLNGLGLFDYPVFLVCSQLDDSLFIPMLVFNVCEQQYHLILCSRVYESIFTESKPEHYNAYLLQISRYLYTGESIEEMADVVKMCGREMKSLESHQGLFNS